MTSNESDKQFTSCTAVIKSGQTKPVAIGAYSKSEPTPEFDVVTKPDIQDMLGVSIERMDIPGTPRYAMMCQLHNYGDKPCEVTVRRRGAATKELAVRL